MRAMLGDILKHYPSVLESCVILGGVIALFIGWTYYVFRAKSKSNLERGSYLPLDLED